MNKEDKLTAENTLLKRELRQTTKELNEYKKAYNDITGSRLWKLTKPIRMTLDRVKGIASKKSSEPLYAIDDYIIDDEKVFIKGWVYYPLNPDTKYGIVFDDGLNKIKIDLKLLNREDVLKAIPAVRKEECGFEFEAEIRTKASVGVSLSYFTPEDEEHYLPIGDIENMDSWIENPKNLFEIIPINFHGGDFSAFCGDSLNVGVPEASVDFEKTDVIVPVYNGYQYLEKLFETIEKTEVPYRLIIIDDKSPDERVLPFLKNYADSHDEVELIINEENLGFVQSVNKGLARAKNHVAIVNTDVELPNRWLERLMMPIYEDQAIASTTPFTNSGTICSFPEFCKDNDIFENLSVDLIDTVFSRFKVQKTIMPTGVGFCMGMNYAVLQEIGFLDAKTFYKGYGEENDWCQRAIEAGYRNVQVENLFVYHKHGGSFLSEDKKRYIERNLKLLENKHPGYAEMVAAYCRKDPMKQVREFATMVLSNKYAAKKTTLYFEHNWGGGANSYLNNRIKEELEQGMAAIVVVNDLQKGFYVDYHYKKYLIQYSLAKLDDIFELLEEVHVDEIVINELVSFVEIYDALRTVLRIKKEKKVKLTMLLHDFFSICPSLYLLDKDEKYCGVPKELSVCETCIQGHKNLFNQCFESMEKWRAEWNLFLSECDEIIAFSENSKELECRAYNVNDKIIVRPHQVSDIHPVGKKIKKTKTLNIGLLGNLIKHKGSVVIEEMLKLIRKEHYNVRIILIGPDMENIGDKDLIVTGHYRKEDVPDLIRKYDIDIFFIASIWPETFSYTTEEIMKMQMPIAVFDLGAPAERVKNYDKGLIISKIEAKTALEEIMQFSKNRELSK